MRVLGEWRWQILGNVDVADKGEGIVDGQQTLSSALKLRETFISKKRMETPFKKCLFSLMREPK